MATDIYIDRQIAALRQLHHETLQLDRSKISIHDFLLRQTNTLIEAHFEGNDSVVFHFACWSPEMRAMSAPDIMRFPLTMDVAKLSVAREHGFQRWADVEALGSTSFDNDFEQAVDLALSGEASSLSEMLATSPQLAEQTSQFGHAATLLHYVAANGVESHRQIVPLNAVEIVNTLLEAGADVNAEANMYGGGSRVLGLLLSSAHPNNAGICEDVSRLLVGKGAH